MKGYSSNIPENCACARLESVNASYKDLAQVCGRLRKKKSDWALTFLEQAAEGKIPVFYRKHNKRLGHRRELGGKKGRYPKKAARVVLKLLKSAIANGRAKGLGDDYTILAASANKKEIYPRMASKGRQARSFLETSRIELVLQGPGVPKGVTVTPPAKKEERKKEAPAKEKKKEEKPAVKKESPKKEEKPAAKEPKPKTSEPETKKEEPPKQSLKEEGKAHHEHKHEAEKAPAKEGMPHQHGEYDKR